MQQLRMTIDADVSPRWVAYEGGAVKKPPPEITAKELADLERMLERERREIINGCRPLWVPVEERVVATMKVGER